MKDEFSIRPATQDDYQYCYRLTKKNMHELFLRHWGGWNPSEFRKSFDVNAVSMVMVNGRRSGYYSIKNTKNGIHIDNIQLSPAIQGRGIGTEILEDLLRKYGNRRISLRTFTDNPAKRLYERFGFKIIERVASTILMEKAPMQS
jgi:ribosomal protein S18 acetylase RimI-like enzyme